MTVSEIRVAGRATGRDTALHSSVPQIRMISAADEGRLEQFGGHLSQRSRYQRFFSPRGFLPGEVRRLTDLDPNHEVALVATIDVSGAEHIVGVARYVIDSLHYSAEMAIVIADQWQNRGLGRTLLSQLMANAAQHGIRTIHGAVLATNFGMQRLASSMGFELRRVAREPGVLQMTKRLAAEH